MFYKIENNNAYLKIDTYVYTSFTFSLDRKDTFIRLDNKYDYLSDESFW